VQKALYPEGARTCHVIVVHPPGGVVGGDQLESTCGSAPAARCWPPRPAPPSGTARMAAARGQDVRLQVGDGAALEWLPQETIFYDGAGVELEHEVELGADATYIGSEILCFGRRAMGERFVRGKSSSAPAFARPDAWSGTSRAASTPPAWPARWD
jgi:urease accessory protein